MMNFISRLLILLSTSVLIVSCGGGGGSSSGSSTPPAPTYLKVVSVSPQAGASAVAYDAQIKLNFSDDFDSSLFLNTNAKIGSLLIAKDLVVVMSSDLTVALMDTEVEALTLGELESGDYIVTADLDDESSLDPITAFKINEADFENTLVLSSALGKSFSFSHAELASTALFEQNMIELSSSDGTKVKGRLKLGFRSIEFLSYSYLNYNETYTISVSKSLKSDSNYSLQNAFSSSFTIEDLPPVDYVSYSPTGIDNSPFQSLDIAVNFDLVGSDLDQAIRVYEVSTNEAGEPLSIEQEVSRAIGSDKRSVKLVRENYWEHDKTYKVIVKGEYLLGVAGNSGPLSLAGKDLEWEFVTSSPKLNYFYPNSGDAKKSFGVDGRISVGFNFPVDYNVIQAFVSIQDDSGEYVNYDITASDSVLGKYYLKPLVDLKYKRDYTVVVGKEVFSSINPEVHLADNVEFEFTTEPKSIESLSPYDGQQGLINSTDIEVKFNFPVEVDPANFIKLTEVHDGISTRLDFSASLSFDKRSLTITPKKDGHSYSFFFNANVSVDILHGIAGANTAGFEDYFYQFGIQNSELMYVSSVPLDGTALVPVNNSTVSVTFNRDIFDDPNMVSPIWIEYTNCHKQSGTITGGYYTISGKTIYFDPYSSSLQDSGYFGSACSYEIRINPDLRGVSGEEFESNADLNIRFDTDYLDIEDVFVEYAYGDRVAVDSDIDLEFSHYIQYGFSDSNFEIDQDGYTSTYFYSSKSGDEISINPSGDLDFGVDYTLWVYRVPGYSWASPIRANSGERLDADYYFDFTTENMDIEVDSYSPYGSGVSVGSDVYIETNYSESHQGYPEFVEVDVSAYYYDYDSESNRTYHYSSSEYKLKFWSDEIDVEFDEDLFYEATYDIVVRFIFHDGEEVEYTWDFDTEDLPSVSSSTPVAQSKSPRKTSSKMDRNAKRDQQRRILSGLDPRFKFVKGPKRTKLRKRSKVLLIKDLDSMPSHNAMSRKELQSKEAKKTLKRPASK